MSAAHDTGDRCDRHQRHPPLRHCRLGRERRHRYDLLRSHLNRHNRQHHGKLSSLYSLRQCHHGRHLAATAIHHHRHHRQVSSQSAVLRLQARSCCKSRPIEGQHDVFKYINLPGLAHSCTCELPHNPCMEKRCWHGCTILVQASLHC